MMLTMMINDDTKLSGWLSVCQKKTLKMAITFSQPRHTLLVSAYIVGKCISRRR